KLGGAVRGGGSFMAPPAANSLQSNELADFFRKILGRGPTRSPMKSHTVRGSPPAAWDMRPRPAVGWPSQSLKSHALGEGARGHRPTNQYPMPFPCPIPAARP